MFRVRGATHGFALAITTCVLGFFFVSPLGAGSGHKECRKEEHHAQAAEVKWHREGAKSIYSLSTVRCERHYRVSKRNHSTHAAHYLLNEHDLHSLLLVLRGARLLHEDARA